jgi:hypothetical protein
MKKVCATPVKITAAVRCPKTKELKDDAQGTGKNDGDENIKAHSSHCGKISRADLR